MSGTTLIGNGVIQSQTIGQGGTLAAAALIAIGANAGGSGTVSILSGGTVDSGGSLFVGDGAGSNGTVSVASGGTLETTGTLTPGFFSLQVGIGAAGATTAAANGVVSVQGIGAVLTTNGNAARIGDTGIGTLLVLGGATAKFGIASDSASVNSALSVAPSAGSAGTIVVSGAGSRLTAVGDVFFAHSGTASLTVANSATLLAGDTVYGLQIGNGNTIGTGGTATAFVTSDGYVFSDNNIDVALGGDTGTLEILSGGKVEAANAIYVGNTNSLNGILVGGTGFVFVGAGSTLQADGANISTTGSSAIGVGVGPGSSGTLDVSGSGALVTTSGDRFGIGTGTAGGGNGVVTISAGGTIASGTPFPATDSALVIGVNGGTGALTVTDSGSSYDAAGQIRDGDTGAGTLLVENGGTVNSGGSTIAPSAGFVIGYGTASTGAVTVTGAGSNIVNVGQFIVGGNSTGTYEASQSLTTGGPGTLLIAAGGLVKTSRTDTISLSSPGADIAADPGTGGSAVTVTGANSTWQIGGPLLVGDDAAGTLTVSAAGTVSATGIDVGVAATGGGVIGLSGTGSQINVSGLVMIGDASSGALSIGAGATLTAGTLAVGAGDNVLLGGLLNVLGSINNSGTIAAANGSSEIAGTIGGAGSLLIGANADLQIDGAVGSGQSVAFTSPSSTLTVENATAFAGTITGVQLGDAIDIVDASSGTFSGDVLQLYAGANAIGTLAFSSLPTSILLEFGPQVSTGVPCYCRGTLILTDHGEVAVEDLRIGDRLITRSGVARPIIWIGQRSYAGRFVGANPELLPILIRAGALADNTPRRDLYVSPLHAMYLDELLIPASALVNGRSIVQVEAMECVAYFHIELATHDVILAEGALSETFIDDDSRGLFHNAAEYQLLYPGAARAPAQYCAPRVEAGEALEDVRRKIAARAPNAPEVPAFGGLLGCIDVVRRDRIEGWAQNSAQPDEPVRLEILDNGVVIARGLANRYRPDLASAGIGRGWHSFAIRIPGGLSPLTRHIIQVRSETHGVDIGVPTLIEAGSRFDASLEQEIAYAVAALHSEDEHERVLSFLLAQVERLRQQRSDIGAQRSLRQAAGESRRGLGKPVLRALVIDETLPDIARDGGSAALLSHMHALQRLGYEVSFAAADMGPSGRDLPFIICAAPFYASVEDVLRRQEDCFDVVYLHRVSIASRYLPLVRRYAKRARVIYSVADLHHLRLARQAEIEARPELLAESQRVRLAEFMAACSADAVITHSSHEAGLLRQAVPHAKVYVVPWSMKAAPVKAAFAKRQSVAFIGNFAHAPNVDAAHFLAEEVMPLVRAQDKRIDCLLVGSAMPLSIKRLARDGVVPIGQVGDLAEVFGRVRLTVAPLRYGAGVKAKVLASFAAGVPCVMSRVAAEGIALPPALDDLVGASPAEMAARIVQLHSDRAANRRAALAGISLIKAGFRDDDIAGALLAAIGGDRALELSAGHTRLAVAG